MNTKRYLSYSEALDGVVSRDDVEALCGLVESVKNWGDHRARLPAHLIVRLIDEIKTLKEQQVNFYAKAPESHD